MSSIPSHDGPSNHSTFFDYSHNETANYTNRGQHASVIHNHQLTTNYQSIRPSQDPLGMLSSFSLT